jgi:PrtD family type I secretion system ABC transporter
LRNNPAPQGATEKPLAGALGPLRGSLIAVVIFSFFINLLMFVAPLYMLQVYDRVLTSQNVNTLVMLTILAAGLLIVFAGLEQVRARVLVRVGYTLDRNHCGSVFDRVFERSVTQPGGSHPQAFRDLDNVRDFLTGPGLIALCDAPWVPLFLAVVFLFHPMLGMVAAAGALTIFILALANEFATRKPLTEAANAGSSANAFVATGLRNAEAVAAMGMTSDVRGRWASKHAEVIGHQAKANDRASGILAASKGVRMGLQVAILGAGAYLVLGEQITPGTMIAASIIMGRALAPVEAAVSQWRGVINARGAYRRLNALLASDTGRSERMRLPTPSGRLEVGGLVLVPPGGSVPVLRGASLRADPGQAIGVIGPSGAGKSSLARALVGVWSPASGHVRLDGAAMSDWDAEQLGTHLGYLPQDVELFDGTVAENIARMGPVDADAVVAAARTARAHDLILGLPQGYETRVGAGGHILSGGQRQRVALARAVYGDVRLIVLDEPNANLDSEGERALTAAIDTLRDQGRTVVMITHKPQLLTSVDLVLALEGGKVTAFGAKENVLPKFTRPAVVRESGGADGRGRTTASGPDTDRASASADGADDPAATGRAGPGRL